MVGRGTLEFGTALALDIRQESEAGRNRKGLLPRDALQVIGYGLGVGLFESEAPPPTEESVNFTCPVNTCRGCDDDNVRGKALQHAE